MPAPEEITQDYAFTITLKPPLYRFNLREQIEKTKDKLLKMTNYVAKLTLVAEVTKNLNVHYHGIVAFEKEDQYHGCSEQYCAAFKDVFRKSKDFGFICIKPIDNFPKWVAYILKDRKRTFALTRTHPLLCDGHELENMFERAELRINNYWPVLIGQAQYPDQEYAIFETVEEIEKRINTIINNVQAD